MLHQKRQRVCAIHIICLINYANTFPLPLSTFIEQCSMWFFTSKKIYTKKNTRKKQNCNNYSNWKPNGFGSFQKMQPAEVDVAVLLLPVSNILSRRQGQWHFVVHTRLCVFVCMLVYVVALRLDDASDQCNCGRSSTVIDMRQHLRAQQLTTLWAANRTLCAIQCDQLSIFFSALLGNWVSQLSDVACCELRLLAIIMCRIRNILSTLHSQQATLNGKLNILQL